MTNKELKEEFDLIIKNVVAPFFKRLGFKKNGTHFFRETEELVQVFNFQKGRFNMGNKFSFVGNIGFIEPDTYLKLWKKDALPKFPKYTDALVEFRLGKITHDGLDHWYYVTKDNHNLVSQLERDLKQVEDVFENHKSIKSLEIYFSDRTNVLAYFGELLQFAL